MGLTPEMITTQKRAETQPVMAYNIILLKGEVFISNPILHRRKWGRSRRIGDQNSHRERSITRVGMARARTYTAPISGDRIIILSSVVCTQDGIKKTWLGCIAFLDGIVNGICRIIQMLRVVL